MSFPVGRRSPVVSDRVQRAVRVWEALLETRVLVVFDGVVVAALSSGSISHEEILHSSWRGHRRTRHAVGGRSNRLSIDAPDGC
jgi:hypothetical protein